MTHPSTNATIGQSAASPAAPTARRICLTPTKNEAWIIQTFLAATKCWAHEIVVADQGSTDGTREILRSSADVHTLINDATSFDERHRQRILLEKARSFSGKRILIGLDADEAFSADSLESPEWKLIEQAPPGTVLRFPWINILAGFKQAWIPDQPLACGFVDDGSEHSGRKIHSPRVPRPENAPVLDLKEIKVLHFQYIFWERMTSKQRWYQAMEHCRLKDKTPLELFRQYNHMHGSWAKHELAPVDPSWYGGYEERGANFRSLVPEPITWWDREVLEMIEEHGASHFRRIAIWDHDWQAAARRLNKSPKAFQDPRSFMERSVHRLLRDTQGHRGHILVRLFEKVLRSTRW